MTTNTRNVFDEIIQETSSKDLDNLAQIAKVSFATLLATCAIWFAVSAHRIADSLAVVEWVDARYDENPFNQE